MKSFLKALASALAACFILPELLSYQVRKALFGADRALEGSSQTLSLLPGLVGAYLRTAFLRRVLAECHASTRVEFGTLFSKAGARLGRRCYIGPRCCIGLAHLGDDVLVAAGVHIPSGGRIHGIDDASRPIREQAGTLAVVRIGEGAWIGANAVIMADVGCHSIVGAGAVVTQPVPDHAVAAGVPARVIRSRLPAAPVSELNDNAAAELALPAEAFP